jgi:DDE family transposase
VGETQQRPFQLSFNSSLKVDFHGSRVTSDGGLVQVRELDQRLGLSELMGRHLSDSRRGKNIQLPLAYLRNELELESQKRNPRLNLHRDSSAEAANV